MTDKTKITVVTVCYNAATAIEETIQSVINQTYSNIEYIIIDGGSRDGTVDIIKKYADKIAYWVSEPDEGIYDAMNKGIDVATGEWINFMNAGDIFYKCSTINSVFNESFDGVDVVYGDTIAVNSFGMFTIKAASIDRMKCHIPFCHQSCFIRLLAMRRRHYDLKYRISADYNFFYKLLFEDDGVFRYIDRCISIFDSETGLSSKNLVFLKKENAIIQGKSKSVRWKIYLFGYKLYLGITGMIKGLIPNKILTCYYHHR